MIDSFGRLEENISRINRESILHGIAQSILSWISLITIDAQIQRIISHNIIPEVYEWYKIYDLWQPFDQREFTYFEIEYSEWDMQTHHHEWQNAVVAVLGWEWEAYIWWIRSEISKGSILFLPAWISHGIEASKGELLKLVSIQDTPIFRKDWTRDFHLDQWELTFEKTETFSPYILNNLCN